VLVPVGAMKSAEYCSSLCELTLSNNHFDDADAVIIAEALSRNSHIEKIDLRGNDLTDQGGKAFESICSLNKLIQNLKLSDRGGGGREASPQKEKVRRQNSATAA